MSRPLVPLSQVVLKIHSRCDLACDHCYVYEAADQSWRGRPMVISQEVTAQAARRIADHAAAHSLPAAQAMCLDLANRFPAWSAWWRYEFYRTDTADRKPARSACTTLSHVVGNL
jgi:hypothetical protein